MLNEGEVGYGVRRKREMKGKRKKKPKEVIISSALKREKAPK